MLLPHLKTQEFVHDEDGSFNGRLFWNSQSKIAYKFSTEYSWGFVFNIALWECC